MENKNKKKKSGGGVTALIFLLIFALPRLLEALEDSHFDRWLSRWFWQLQVWMIRMGLDPELLPAIVVGLLLLLVILIAAVKASRKKRDAEAPRMTANASAGRTSAATRRPDPRTRSFTPPEPSCIVCDHTGEDHFLRDKAQRIAQLDEWLKNGLIDRDEYRVLKDRYERDL